MKTLFIKGPDLQEARTRLKESVNIEGLKTADDTKRLNDLFLYSARNLAIANAFLPDDKRTIAVVSYLCARALDAYEDIPNTVEESIIGLESALNWLITPNHSCPEPPIAHSDLSDSDLSDTDRVECMIAAELPLLKKALAQLSQQDRTRVHCMLHDMAQGMLNHLQVNKRNRIEAADTYGQQVLTRTLHFAFDLLDLDVPPELDLSNLGRSLQALNNIRDFSRDFIKGDGSDPYVDMMLLLLELVESASLVSHHLTRIKFPAYSYQRAAITYLVQTSLGFICKQAKQPPPWLTARPYLSAKVSYYSQDFFDEANQELDRVLLILVNNSAGFNQPGQTLPELGSELNSAQASFELAIAEQYKNPPDIAALSAYLRLTRLAIIFTQAIPDHSITSCEDVRNYGRYIMISDYFHGAAIDAVSHMDESLFPIVHQGAEQQLLERLDRSTIDPNGTIAATMTKIVWTDHLEPKALQALVDKNRQHSRRLCVQSPPLKSRSLTRFTLQLIEKVRHNKKAVNDPNASEFGGYLESFPGIKE